MNKEYIKIKERLLLILNSQKTYSYFKQCISNFPISGSLLILNLIIKKLFVKEKDITIISFKQKSKISHITIYNKKILIRLHNFHSQAKKISFKNFSNINLNNEDILEYVFDEVNEELNRYDYIFLIREEYEEAYLNREKKFKSVLHYYLIPTEIYKINEEEKKQKINQHKKRLERYEETKVFNTFFSSESWDFFNFNNFNLKYNNSLLDKYNIGSPYINC